MIFGIFKESANTFEGQEPGETVVMIVRRHPFFMIVKFIVTLVVAFTSFAVLVAYGDYLIAYDLAGVGLFALTVWIMLLWMVFFYHFTMYTLDVWIVTDKRIIDSTQHGFFSRNIAELHTTRVQDISVRLDGFLQSALHFGDVQVQTAGTEEKFKFIQVPRPESIKNEIMKMAHLDHKNV